MDLPSTIHYFGELLGRVISEQESPALFEIEEKIRANAKAYRAGDTNAVARLASDVAALSVAQARVVASAFTLYFDLVNLAEEAQRVQALRERERENFQSRSANRSLRRLQPSNDAASRAIRSRQCCAI